MKLHLNFLEFRILDHYRKENKPTQKIDIAYYLLSAKKREENKIEYWILSPASEGREYSDNKRLRIEEGAGNNNRKL